MSDRLTSLAARNEALIFTELDDTVVMMDADEGRYYELDPVGARIWALLETARPVAEVCDALVAEYEVAPDTCRADVLAFLEEAAGRGIIRLRAAKPPEAGNDVTPTRRDR